MLIGTQPLNFARRCPFSRPLLFQLPSWHLLDIIHFVVLFDYFLNAPLLTLLILRHLEMLYFFVLLWLSRADRVRGKKKKKMCEMFRRQLDSLTGPSILLACSQRKSIWTPNWICLAAETDCSYFRFNEFVHFIYRMIDHDWFSLSFGSIIIGPKWNFYISFSSIWFALYQLWRSSSDS